MVSSTRTVVHRDNKINRRKLLSKSYRCVSDTSTKPLYASALFFSSRLNYVG
jgi:hypothetical protein